jgi:hypothetical protein
MGKTIEISRCCLVTKTIFFESCCSIPVSVVLQPIPDRAVSKDHPHLLHLQHSRHFPQVINHGRTALRGATVALPQNSRQISQRQRASRGETNAQHSARPAEGFRRWKFAAAAQVKYLAQIARQPATQVASSHRQMALRNQVHHVVGVEIRPASVVHYEGNQLGNGGIFGGYGGGANGLDIGQDSGTSENYLLHVALKIGGHVRVARCV